MPVEIMQPGETVTVQSARGIAIARSPSYTIGVTTGILGGGGGVPYEGEYEVTPTESEQILAMEGLKATQDVTIHAIPSQYIVPSGTVVIDVNGVHDVTAYASASVDIATGEDGNDMAYGDSSYLVGTAKAGTGYTWTTIQGVLEIGRGLIDEGRVA